MFIRYIYIRYFVYLCIVRLLVCLNYRMEKRLFIHILILEKCISTRLRTLQIYCTIVSNWLLLFVFLNALRYVL